MIGNRWSRAMGAMTLTALLFEPVAAAAQDAVAAQNAAAPAYVTESASPFGVVKMDEELRAKLAMPKLAFTASPTDAQDFDKYYVFHRPETSFAEAYADIVECDGYARGLSSGVAYQEVPYPYAGTMAGAIGGAIGNALAVAIFGSAEKRRLRRVNIRQCMNFKGYERFGLSKDLWKEFNFEEGLSGVTEKDRQRCLMLQAMVASAPTQPQGEVLGL